VEKTMEINLKEAIAIVKLNYPYAKSIPVESLSIKNKGTWYQIITPNRVTWVGQGNTEREAWISAAQYVVEGE
jgi:hypothetical protein